MLTQILRQAPVQKCFRICRFNRWLPVQRMAMGWLVLVLAVATACAQVSQPQDSAKSNSSHFADRARAAIREVKEKNYKKYEDEAVELGQQRTLDLIIKETQAAKLYMQSELDTVSIGPEIRKAKNTFDVAKKNIFMGAGEVATHRNLTVSSAIVTQLLRDMQERKTQVDRMTQRLVGYRYRLDSLSTDSLLFTLSEDSARIIAYMNKLMISNLSVKPADSLIDSSLKRLQLAQSQLDPFVFELDLALQGLEAEKEQLSGKLLDAELPPVWDRVRLSSWTETIRFSYAKEIMAFRFYLTNYAGRFLIVLAAMVISMTFLRALKSRWNEHRGGDQHDSPQVLARPVASSLLIVISLFHFIFIDPPFIVSVFFWLVSIAGLTLIFRGYIGAYWMRFWLVMSVLFLAACFSNLLLQASVVEGWLMLALSLGGAAYGLKVLLGAHLSSLKEHYVVYALRFMVASEFIAAIFNVIGRYNLSKTLMISGYVGLIVGILFLWAVRMINEALRLANSVYKTPDKKLFYINFDRLGDRAPVILYVLLCVGWLILVGRNYFEYKQIVRPLSLIISETRTIGNYDFTIRDVLLFIGISGSSVMLSRIVSFFATEPGILAADKSGSVASIAANWLLLIRILIITSGILLAFAASGIAFDRLTIIIGALGVGVGLGLQSLVSNLVSGLIIAFERPVAVGDQVEVNGKAGIMKSVGFRSSVISLADGACMIVPNGDLLSQHLINWTMGKDKRRLIITVGVAYGTDLDMVKQVLLQVIGENENVLAQPQPVVIAKDFNASSIDLDLIFWVRNLDQSFFVRDEVVRHIDRAFRDKGIVIPFPQQDINVNVPKILLGQKEGPHDNTEAK